MSLLSNLNKKAANVKLTTTIGFNKRKDTIPENAGANDSQTTITQTSITEVTVAEVAEVDQEQSKKGESEVTEETVMNMLSQLDISNNLKHFDLPKNFNLNRMPSLRGGTGLFYSKTTVEEVQVEPPLDTKLESVYIVLRPLKLEDAPETGLKKLGRLVKAVEFENYLLLQHWGVLVGDRYYHLHTDDDKRLSVSLLPFIDIQNDEARHTIKIPIWRTSLSHEERVGIAMGDFKEESEVEITDENGKIITDAEDRERFRMKGRYREPPLSLKVFKGGYNPLANNCIHFTKHYIFDQLLLRMTGVAILSSNIQWIVKKWVEMGYKKSPKELAKHLADIFGITNPFSMTPTKSAKVLIKLLSIFLDIDYNPTLDEKLAASRKATSDQEASTAVTTEDNVKA
ncbi:hypothetical protein K435DRAFT_777138 [Dendrothele bispora CBS 962.96]|uniref:Uncharacterized protein n=1 Tax=Dendrothele bispora (strain CBS 962.96) TaxID=1314807 RepID=A0A4S8MAP6_DENBC|nr:hypothetical protein K435DRAFT_777138 [Dendrothele bispora CBS 962.96]